MNKCSILYLCAAFLLTGCAHEYNQVYKSNDYSYKYEYAKACFVSGQYTKATTLLQELIVQEKGRKAEQESLYMLAMSEFLNKDYSTASEAFKKYVKSFPRGVYAEQATFYVGESLFQGAPEPRLDQSETINAIAAFQDYLDIYTEGALKQKAQQRLFALQDKLVEKELNTARLYYNLGTYFGNCTSGGNNYQACVVTAQNALKDYPYSNKREEFATLIMKSKFELAQQSVEEKKAERMQDAEDECYGFINEYPDSKERRTAEMYIEKCKKALGTDKETTENNDNNNK